MKQAAYIFVLAIVLTSCELFVIRSPKTPRLNNVDISQNSALGAVYLFKTELDSNNKQAAASVLAQNDGKKYLALQRYEMLPEISRIKRIIGNLPVTNVKADTLSDTKYKFKVQFDYINEITFVSTKIKDEWYIISYNEDVTFRRE